MMNIEIGAKEFIVLIAIEVINITTEKSGYIKIDQYCLLYPSLQILPRRIY